MVYRIAAIPMTSSDIRGHSPTSSLFKCGFSYSWAADVQILIIDIARPAVPLR